MSGARVRANWPLWLFVSSASWLLVPVAAFAQGGVSGASGRPPILPSQTAVVYKAKPEDKIAIQEFLSALDRGDRVTIAFEPRNAFIDAWDKTASAWLHASEGDKDRRRRILALAVLQAGHDGLNDSFTWNNVRWLIEWECDQIRRGPPTEFEHAWLAASIVLIQAAGDQRFLAPAAMRCERLQPCDHAWHALSRFPDDSEFKFAHALPNLTVKPFARQPGELLHSPNYGKPAFVDSMRLTFEGLQAFQDDPVIGLDVRLRRGLLYYALDQREECLRDLSLAFTKSDDPYTRYVAAFVTGLVHEAEGRSTEASTWYETALQAMPNVRSGATWLAARYFLAGRRDDAFTLMDRVYASPSPESDPWHRTSVSQRWVNYFERLREMVKR